jgi:tripartite-type tricarboxylate transporter receptor subunit TctC
VRLKRREQSRTGHGHDKTPRRDGDGVDAGCCLLRGGTGARRPIVAKISQALEAAVAAPGVREKLDLAGCTAKSASLGEFAGIIKSDIALWARVVKDAGIPAD